MLKKGDIVRVISKTHFVNEMEEFIPIGSICEITEVCRNDDGEFFYGINNIKFSSNTPYYYLGRELEKFIPMSKTEESTGITYDRLVEIATKWKDALVDNTTLKETIEYSREEFDITDTELDFFGLIDCDSEDCNMCIDNNSCPYAYNEEEE